MTVDFLLFITSHFTTNAQIITHLNQYTHEQKLSWSVSRSLRSRGVANGLKVIKKCAGDVSVRFQLELNTLGFLGTAARKEI